MKVTDDLMAERGILDELIEETKPASPTFIVTIRGKEIVFRHLTDQAEFEKLKKTSAAFAKGVAGGKGTETMRPYISKDPGVNAKAYFLSKIAESPLPVTKLLQAAAEAPLLFQAIVSAVESQLSVDVQVGALEEIEELKND